MFEGKEGGSIFNFVETTYDFSNSFLRESVVYLYFRGWVEIIQLYIGQGSSRSWVYDLKDIYPVVLRRYVP